MRKSNGFTLIELMIVVAIIGILAAIAIPNFLTFQCKSKQTEAKAGLSALFASEKSFLAEHNTYGTDLLFVNWEPQGSPLYLYGFGTAYPSSIPDMSGYDGTRKDTGNAAVVGSPIRYSTLKMRDLNNVQLTAASLPATACTTQSFIMGAVADISPDVAVQLDKWTIDDRRDLSNVANDCIH